MGCLKKELSVFLVFHLEQLKDFWVPLGRRRGQKPRKSENNLIQLYRRILRFYPVSQGRLMRSVSHAKNLRILTFKGRGRDMKVQLAPRFQPHAKHIFDQSLTFINLPILTLDSYK